MIKLADLGDEGSRAEASELISLNYYMQGKFLRVINCSQEAGRGLGACWRCITSGNIDTGDQRI